MRKMLVFLMAILLLIVIIINIPLKSEEPVEEEKVKEEIKGVFISYIDYGHFKNKSKQELESLITEMINNVSYFGLNAIILQVRPFSDAIYPSEIYPSSKVIVNEEGDSLPLDVLKYFISKAKEKDIEIYAWVNPYRIRTKNDITDISKKAYYYKWFDTNNIERTKNGIYLNPASNEVLDYITNGLKELCENYDIKGVIYDDYFYPSDTIDLENYEETDKSMTLKEYRLNNINNLLKRSYETIKSVDENLKFGISPAGNIENNLDFEYLDVKHIMGEDYLDLIIPQLYYGFNNSSKPYINTLEDWSKLNTLGKDFYVALSLYKSGKVDEYAGSGENEWLEETNIIKKQILISRNIKNYQGFFIFRYEYLFNTYDNHNLTKEVENLKDLIDNS